MTTQRSIKELRNDVKKGREVRQGIISKYGFVPESILKINYQKNNMLKQMVTTQNEKSKEYHKDKYYASEPDLLKALGASSKSVRGKEGGLSIFPYHLAEFIVKFYSEKNETIFDPFMGHNSRMEVCFNLGRNYIGYDISKDFMQKNFKIKERLYTSSLIPNPPNIEIFERDSRKILEEDESIDMIFTSPPYWDLEYYGEEDAQIGENRPYYEFLKQLQIVLLECSRILKYDKYMIINVNDFRKDGFYSYHSDVIQLLKDSHMQIYDTIIVDWGSSIASCFASQLESRKMVAKRHEYLLVFKKT